jgi:hypothetical protein
MMDPIFEQLEAQTAINNHKVSLLLQAIEKIRRIQQERKTKR